MTGKIVFNQRSKRVTEIDIEGIIGVPEHAQFDEQSQRVSTYESFRAAIDRIAATRARTVVVNIRSTGGGVNDALLIYDALAGLDAEVVTRCYGYVASAATVIAQAASPGRREISPNALYLIHQSSSAVEGNSGEMTTAADLLGKTDERIAAVYADASGRGTDRFVALMRENGGGGRWLTAAETIAEGLADRMIGPGRIRNALRGWLGIDPPALPAPPPPAGAAAGTPVGAARELERQIADYETPADPTEDREIADLQHRIVELEALNAKLRAKATQTLPREDPSTREIRAHGNVAAYESDLQKFKS